MNDNESSVPNLMESAMPAFRQKLHFEGKCIIVNSYQFIEDNVHKFAIFFQISNACIFPQ